MATASTPAIAEVRIAEPDEAVHARLVRARVGEIAAALQGLLGQKLTAVIAGVADAQAVGDWARGTRRPHPKAEERPRHAYQVAELLAREESRETVRAWFIGMNPELDDHPRPRRGGGCRHRVSARPAAPRRDGTEPRRSGRHPRRSLRGVGRAGRPRVDDDGGPPAATLRIEGMEASAFADTPSDRGAAGNPEPWPPFHERGTHRRLTGWRWAAAGMVRPPRDAARPGAPPSPRIAAPNLGEPPPGRRND